MSKDKFKRALGIHDTIAGDLVKLGGEIVCKSDSCGHREAATADVLGWSLRHGWTCRMCGGNVRWDTQKVLDDEG